MSNRTESSNRSGRFNILKNIKAFRDEHHSFDDPSFGDSGYTSSRQLTFNSTEHGSIRQSTSIMKTIDEEQAEQVMTPSSKSSQTFSSGKKAMIVTPTTQSIQKMSNLRLQTPEGQSSMDISPVVSEPVTNPITPPELMLSLREKSIGNSTPKKSKLYGRKRSFRDNIDNENDCEEKRFCPNQIKDDINEKLAKRIPISPIIKQNRRVLRERSVSDNNLVLRSSTPKSLLFRQAINPILTGVVPKQKLISPSKTPKKAKNTLRRYQSFSPSKLAQKHKAELLGKKKILSIDDIVPSTSKDNKEILTNIPEEAEVAAFCRQDALDLSDIQPRDFPTSNTNSIQIEDYSGFDNSAFSISGVDGKSISPITKCPNFEKLFDAPLVNPLPVVYNEREQSVDFSSMSKSFQETYSYRSERPSTSKLIEISPSKSEIRNLLYRDLPKTPIKDDRSLKRTKSKTPVKKSLFNRRTQYYDGMERIDFFMRLQREGVGHLIEEIFKYVSDDDIICASMVSAKWKHLIDDCRSIRNRRVDYITNKKKYKENVRLKNTKLIHSEVENQYRKAFSVHNYDTRGMTRQKQLSQHSPPASPDTVRFKENQKVIRRLSPRAMTTCPRCSKPSPIITQKKGDCIVKIGRSTRSSAKKSAELRKTLSDSSTSQYRNPLSRSPVFNFDDSSSSTNSSGSERKIRRSLFPSSRTMTHPYDVSKRNSLNSSLNSSTSLRSSFGVSESCLDFGDISSDSIEEYAMCTGKSCGFKFCIRCQCEYKSNHECRLSMELTSPGREEESGRNVSNRIGSRQSKRSLRRL